FPLDRNNVLATRDASQLLAVTSRHAFVRAPRTPAPRPGAGVAAATRIGDGLVVVISRHALGALGPQFRPTTAPAQQLDALERTGEFLHALARWTRRPAEWAHVPPAACGVPLALGQAPAPIELVPPAMTPPRGVDTMALPLLPDRKLARATSAPERLQPTSVAWIPLLDYRNVRHATGDSSRGARGEGLPAPCALDSTLWTEGLPSAFGALGRLAAEQHTLVIALGLDLDGLRSYSMGQEVCDAAWRRGLAGLVRAGTAGGGWDSLPFGARYPALRDAGLLPRYYRSLEDEVAARATVLRDRVLKQRRDLYFAFRLAQPPADWFTLGLLRGFGLPDRPLLLFTPELWTRDLLALQRARGLNLVHAVALAPPSLRAHDWSGVRRLVFDESDGFWLTPEEPGGPGAGRRLPQDSLGRLLRRLAR